MSNLDNLEEVGFHHYESNASSLYNPNFIDFKKEPMFLGSGKNTQRFDDPKIPFFDKSNDTQQGFDWKHDEIPLIADTADFKSVLVAPEKFIITRNLQKLIFLDSIQGRGPLMIFGQITTLPELENVILTWEYFEGCLVPETQVMTSKGWKRIDMIELTDKVMSVDINGKGNFSEPEKLHTYESNGYITKFEGKNTSQFVTDQHRMLLQDRNTKDRKVKRVENINIHEDGAIKDDIINALSSTNNLIELSNYDRFLIALQADGNIKREYVREDGKTIYKNQNGNLSNKISIVFTFVKDRKIIRMRELLDNLHLEYSESIYKNDKDNDTVSFRVRVGKEKVISKSFNDWVNLEKISYDWSRQFCEELKYWDGWDYTNPTFGYDTIDKENAELVEIIGTIGGYKTSHSVKEGKINEQPLHRLTFNSKKNYSIGRSIKAERIEYNGKVHCLTVDGGFFVIKHNDKISITGNCKHSRTYTEMLRAFYDKPDEIFDESFQIPELMQVAKKIRSKYDRAYFNVINYVYKEQRGLEYTQEELYELKASILMVWVEINILEGMRFYPGFAAMWGFKESRGLMSGLSENLQFICRDENEHLALTQFVLKLLKKDESEGFTDIYNDLKDEIEERYYEAYREECDWTDYMFSTGSYIGMNGEILKDYLNYVTIRRMKAIGIKPDKEKMDRYIVKNNLPWVDSYINMDKNEKLPQEEKILNYVTGAVDQDMDGLTDVLKALLPKG